MVTLHENSIMVTTCCSTKSITATVDNEWVDKFD